MLRNFSIACATFAGAANTVKLAEATTFPEPLPNKGNWPLLEDYPEFGNQKYESCFSRTLDSLDAAR